MDATTHAIVRECAAMLPADDPGEADAIRAAIFLEDALSVRLPDRLITAEHLGSAERILRTLALDEVDGTR